MPVQHTRQTHAFMRRPCSTKSRTSITLVDVEARQVRHSQGAGKPRNVGLLGPKEPRTAPVYHAAGRPCLGLRTSSTFRLSDRTPPATLPGVVGRAGRSGARRRGPSRSNHLTARGPAPRPLAVRDSPRFTKRRRCVWQRGGVSSALALVGSGAVLDRRKVRDVGPEAVEGEVRSGSECGRAPRG